MWPDGDDGCGADLIPGEGSLRWALAFPVGMGAVTSLSRHPSSMLWLHARGTHDRENSPHKASGSHEPGSWSGAEWGLPGPGAMGETVALLRCLPESR